ncbi:hypothetical protein ACS0TY_013894 [Phlomoides rotata]
MARDPDHMDVIGIQKLWLRPEKSRIWRRVRIIHPPTVANDQLEALKNELPFNFKQLNYEYDGTIDPYEHLMPFENFVILHRYGE